MNKNSNKWVYVIIGGLVCANVFALSVVYDLSKDKYLKVDFFDVGQGDSIFIEASNKNQVLIDGGPSSQVLEKLGKEMPFYDRTIDLVILTHSDSDHLFGLLDVLKNYKVKSILYTGIGKNSAEFQEWQDLIKKENADINISQAGQKIVLSSNPLIYIDVIFPPKDSSFSNNNDASIISRLNFNATSFLFMGDATEKVYSGLSNVDSDVLKVAHHGSKDSYSQDFINSVSPKIAVISVGKDNKYGHPDVSVLENLNKSGIQVLRTDESGDIRFLSDGKIINVK